MSNDSRDPNISQRGSPEYNRFRYYSALKTGYQHLNKEEFLSLPKHVIDPNLYVP